MTTSTSMTDGHTARRTLAYRYHNIEPGPYDYSPARDQWRVEQALARALDRHDTIEAAVAEVNAEQGWSLDPAEVFLLLDCSDLVVDLALARIDDLDYHDAVDDYCEVLRAIVRIIRAMEYVGRHRDGRTARTSDYTGTHRVHVVIDAQTVTAATA